MVKYSKGKTSKIGRVKMKSYLKIIFFITMIIALSEIEVRAADNPVHIIAEESERPQIGKKLSVSIDNAQNNSYHYIWTVGERSLRNRIIHLH